MCKGSTGHAEVAKVVFDTNIISFSKILEIFFHIHDPTSLNRQGNDIGTQYRSVIFYSSESQLKKLKKYYRKLKINSTTKITEINGTMEFYQAEDYHINYYNLNKSQPYCNLVISPKVSLFKKSLNYLKN